MTSLGKDFDPVFDSGKRSSANDLKAKDMHMAEGFQGCYFQLREMGNGKSVIGEWLENNKLTRAFRGDILNEKICNVESGTALRNESSVSRQILGLGFASYYHNRKSTEIFYTIPWKWNVRTLDLNGFQLVM